MGGHNSVRKRNIRHEARKGLDEFWENEIQMEINRWIIPSGEKHGSERVTPEDSERIHRGGN